MQYQADYQNEYENAKCEAAYLASQMQTLHDTPKVTDGTIAVALLVAVAMWAYAICGVISILMS